MARSGIGHRTESSERISARIEAASPLESSAAASLAVFESLCNHIIQQNVKEREFELMGKKKWGHLSQGRRGSFPE